MTAVNWMIDELIKKHVGKVGNEYVEIFEQAKEQEKQDIISAYAFGHNDGCRYMTNEKQEFEHGEAYFAETFKQDL